MSGPFMMRHGGADGNSRLFGDDQSRADHRVDLAKVAGQRILIGHVEDPDDPVAAECDLPILRGALSGTCNSGRAEQPTRSAFPEGCGFLFSLEAGNGRPPLCAARGRSPFPGGASYAGTTRLSRHRGPRMDRLPEVGGKQSGSGGRIGIASSGGWDASARRRQAIATRPAVTSPGNTLIRAGALVKRRR